MSLERWLLAFLILAAGAAQYGLIVHALRDLRRRPSVRGGNKTAWGILILAVPFAGALIYSVMGPTSFLPRPNRPPRRSVARLDEDDLR